MVTYVARYQVDMQMVDRLPGSPAVVDAYVKARNIRMHFEDACPHDRQRGHQVGLLFRRGLKEGRHVSPGYDQRMPRRNGIAIPQCKDAIFLKKNAVGGRITEWTGGT